MKMKNNSHTDGFALGSALKQRLLVTWKWHVDPAIATQTTLVYSAYRVCKGV